MVKHLKSTHSIDHVDQCGLGFCLQTRACEYSGHFTGLLYHMLLYFFSSTCLSMSSLFQLPQWSLILLPFCTWILHYCCMCLCTLHFIHTHQSVGHLCFLATAHSAAMSMGVQMALQYTDFIFGDGGGGGTYYLWLHPVEELLNLTVILVLVFSSLFSTVAGKYSPVLQICTNPSL